MKENTLKTGMKRGEGRGFFQKVEKLLALNGMLDFGFPVKYLPHIFFLFLLALIYIGNSHYSEKTIRKINWLEAEVEDLRADYTTLKAEYMLSGKQSEVAEKVKDRGLKESLQPPYKIVIDKREH
ncbi:MAG: FtsL-like putative cell division protein [Cyclobacteriaceae bacterium]|nr:FtsL-like putative cell division protein [Cyclobacteriaceae bacterium]